MFDLSDRITSSVGLRHTALIYDIVITHHQARPTLTRYNYTKHTHTMFTKRGRPYSKY